MQKKLFELPLSVAVCEIKLDGMDYTEEELKEYVEYILMALSKEKSEFDESNLDGVFGGICAKINLSAFTRIMSDGTIGWIREIRIRLIVCKKCVTLVCNRCIHK